MNETGPLAPAATPAVPEARVGTIVDKYSLVRLLGKGGMGAVYEARHATLSRRFAIKFLLPSAATNADAMRRFENEAKAAGGLEHPNLVAVTDLGRDGQGAPYLVMEYLPGEDCARLLGRSGPLAPARAANIVLQACRGLAIAHRAGIIHRDLKPANLFITDAGDGSDLIKVLDFGIAKLKSADATSATGTGETFGTAHYMSPEQARGASDVDARTDVWSLGVVLYELLTARRPFDGGTFLHVVYQILSTQPARIEAARADLPPALIAIIEKAMAKEPGARFQSVMALGEALAPLARPGRPTSIVARGHAETVPTPATGVRPPLESVRLSPDEAGVNRDGAEDRRRGGSRKLALGTVAAVVIAAGAFLGLMASRSRSPARAVVPAPAVAAVPAPAPTAVAAPALAPSPSPSPAPAPHAPPAAVPSTALPAAPVAKRKGGRTVSERSANGPDIRSRPPSPLPSDDLAPPAVVPASAKAQPAQDISSSQHPLGIEEKSPYGR